MIVAAGGGSGWSKGQLCRLDLVAIDICSTKVGDRANGREMLRSQPQPGTVSADMFNAKWTAGERRQAEAGTQHLAAPFTLTTIYVKHDSANVKLYFIAVIIIHFDDDRLPVRIIAHGIHESGCRIQVHGLVLGNNVTGHP